MNKSNYIKLFITVIFFSLGFLISSKAFAATLILKPSNDSVGIGEQFYVDLMLDTGGQSINTISGNIPLPKNIVLLRAEDGKSMIDLWVEKPKQNGESVSFAGVITNGFGGVIDPFNSVNKLPGLIIRFVFLAKEQGSIDLTTSKFLLNLDDGIGSGIEAPSVSIPIKIRETLNKTTYESEGDNNPEIEAYVTHNPDMYDNKYVLIFNAKDKKTGIKSVMIKEGERQWKEIESPYLLMDQGRRSEILLKATNYSEASTVMRIDNIALSIEGLISIFILIVMIVFLSLVIIKKVYDHKKRK